MTLEHDFWFYFFAMIITTTMFIWGGIEMTGPAAPKPKAKAPESSQN